MAVFHIISKNMKQKVYLAGGFKTDWANYVKKCSNNFHWINPKEKEFKNGERFIMNVNEYGKWDLHFIKNSDIIFVYVERTNTSCIGLSCEAGYAKGLGKTVIIVLEPNHETIKDAYLSFLTQVSDIVFTSLQEGIDYLKSFEI
jgi:nucleoside 2-deoxyribosyltransferase